MSGTSRQNSSSTSAVLLKNRSDTSAALMNSSGASAVLTKSSASQQQWQCLQPTVQCRPSWTAMLQFLLKKQQWQCHKSMLNKCLTSCQPSAIELSGMLTIKWVLITVLLKRADPYLTLQNYWIRTQNRPMDLRVCDRTMSFSKPGSGSEFSEKVKSGSNPSYG